MSGEMAVLRVNGEIYGASAGNVFPSVEHAQSIVAENPVVFPDPTSVQVLPILSHGLTSMEGETHDSAGETGIPGRFDMLGAGSPDGTLRDPDRRSLLAVLTDGQNIYGTSEGAEHPAFGELAKAQETITANGANLSAVEIRPFDELLA
jgi:cytolysin (calcineurin-like family phosphatase)